VAILGGLFLVEVIIRSIKSGIVARKGNF
jgi:hypothetical protein